MFLRSLNQSNAAQSAAYTVTLLSGLVFGAQFSHAQEIQGPELIPANPAVEPDAKTLSCTQRIALLDEIQQLASAAIGKTQVAPDELVTKLTRYKTALKACSDFSTEELDKASTLTIGTLNNHPYYGALPTDRKEDILGNEILTFHAALVDKIRTLPSTTPELSVYKARVDSLLGDIVWSDAFKSEKIFDHACRLFGERIFDCDPSDLESRVRLFQEKINSYETLRQRPGTLDGILNFSERYLAQPDFSPEIVEALRDLTHSLSLTEAHHEKIVSLASKYLREEKPEIFLRAFLGPLCGKGLISGTSEEQKTQRQKEPARFLNTAISGNPAKLSDPAFIHSSKWVAAVFEHALRGNHSAELGLPTRVETWADVERRQELRLRAASFSLGVLNGIDLCCVETAPVPEIISAFRGIPIKVPGKSEGPIVREETETGSCLTTARENMRSALGMLCADAWDDTRRAKVVVMLMATDQLRFPSIEGASQYASKRMKELGCYFPDALVGGKDGRYKSKIGGIVHVPPVQAEGDPSVYADLYFYTREGLASARYSKSWEALGFGDGPKAEKEKADKELFSKLASEMAEARQTIFICDLLVERWNEFHTRVPTYQREFLAALEVSFPCFDRSLALKMRLSDVKSDGFFAEVAAVRAEQVQITLKLEPQITAIFQEGEERWQKRREAEKKVQERK